MTSRFFTRNEPPEGPIVKIFIGVAIGATALAYVGQLLFTQVLDREPLILIALNPTKSNLLWANGEDRVDAVPYYVVGFFRHLLTDPIFFLLGFWHGDKAISWIGGRSKSFKTLLDEGEKVLLILAHILVFMTPVSLICALAGAVGMKLRNFIVLNVAGTIFSLVSIRWIGGVAAGPIDSAKDWITDHRWQVFLITVAILAFTILKDFRSPNSEMKFFKNITKK